MVPTISVVIPVKDDAAGLRTCLEALRGQTHAPDEIVVVDNGSRDLSPVVAQHFGCRLIPHPGGGIPAASAAGYDAATGDIVARMDADCVPDPHWLESVVAALEGQPDVAAVTGGAVFADGPRVLRRPLAALYLGAYFIVLTPTLGHVPLFGSNFAMRRSAWRAVTGEVHRADPLVHDDLDLAFHLGRGHRIVFDPSLHMAIALRPLTDPRSYLLRVRRGFHTVILHWPREFPPFRWLRILRRNRLRWSGRGMAIPDPTPWVRR